MSTRLRVAGYARNSGDQQAKDETEIVQIEWLDSQEKTHGWDLTLYIDPGRSGETIAGRPKFRELLEDVRQGKFDAIAVKGIDRLCRSQALTDWATIAETCKAARILIIHSGGRYDLKDPTDALMFTVLGPGMAGYDKANIISRTRDGKARALREGRKPYGRDPYGLSYDRKKKVFEINEEEAKVVRLIFALAIDGKSLADMCDVLTAKGFLGRRGQPFKPSTLSQLLRQTAYVGTWSFKTGSLKVPPILDQKTFDAARFAFANRGGKLGRKEKKNAMLKGLIFCHSCNKPVYSSYVTAGRPSYYSCSSNASFNDQSKRCGNRWRLDRVNDAVWELVTQIVAEPGTFAAIEAKKAKAADRSAELARDLERAVAKLEGLRGKENALTLRFSNGKLSEEGLDHALENLASTRRALEGEIGGINAALAAIERAQAPTGEAVGVMESLRGRMGEATDLERKRVMQALCPIQGRDGAFLFPDGRILLKGLVSVPNVATKLSVNSSRTVFGCGPIGSWWESADRARPSTCSRP